MSVWNKAVHGKAANGGLGAKVSCVRCAKDVSGLLLEGSGWEYRCPAQTLVLNSSPEAGTRIQTQTQTRQQAILFASQSLSSSLPFYIHLYTPDDQHATVTEGNARSHNAPALY